MSPAVDPYLHELIGGIYDAVIEPERWHEAIDRIRLHYSFHVAGLAVNRLPDGGLTAMVSCNVPEEYLEALPRFGNQNLDVWGGPARIFSLPLEEPLLFSEVTKDIDVPQNAWVTEWSEPQGLIDQLAMVLEHNRRMLATLSFGIHEDRPPVTDDVLDGVRILAPHLRRAVTISSLLDETRAAASSFEAALEVAGTGVVLVGNDMHIVHANGSATAMLDRGDPIADRAGQLSVRNEVAPGRLEAVVRAAARTEAEMGQSGIGIPAHRNDGSAVVLHVMPLKHRSLRPGLRPAAAAAVFIAEPGGEPNLPVDALTALYGLSPAEVRVLEMVVRGRSSTDMAQTLGVKPSTVKTHMQSLFDKTARRTRASLFALAREVGAFV